MTPRQLIAFAGPVRPRGRDAPSGLPPDHALERDDATMKRSSADDFWQRVRRGSDDVCWPWTGGLSGGYGVISFQGRRLKAHQLAWELARGPRDGLDVLHSCDNPPCCNPAHLFLGTRRDNNEDKTRKGRQHHPRGTLHGRAKLDDSKVRALRERYAAGGISIDSLAAEFGVAHSLVWRIVHRKAWPHVS